MNFARETVVLRSNEVFICTSRRAMKKAVLDSPAVPDDESYAQSEVIAGYGLNCAADLRAAALARWLG